MAYTALHCSVSVTICSGLAYKLLDTKQCSFSYSWCNLSRVGLTSVFEVASHAKKALPHFHVVGHVNETREIVPVPIIY